MQEVIIVFKSQQDLYFSPENQRLKNKVDYAYHPIHSKVNYPLLDRKR
jgi:hypothetical protein